MSPKAWFNKRRNYKLYFRNFLELRSPGTFDAFKTTPVFCVSGFRHRIDPARKLQRDFRARGATGAQRLAFAKKGSHVTPLAFTEYLSRFWSQDAQPRPVSLVKTAARV
jgi:hypothetical protein